MKVDEHQNDVRLGYCGQGEPCTDILLWIKNLDMEIWNHRLCLLSKPGKYIHSGNKYTDSKSLMSHLSRFKLQS